MTNAKLTKQVLNALNPKSQLVKDQRKEIIIKNKIEQSAKENKILATVGKSTVKAWGTLRNKGKRIYNRFSLKKKPT